MLQLDMSDPASSPAVPDTDLSLFTHCEAARRAESLAGGKTFKEEGEREEERKKERERERGRERHRERKHLMGREKGGDMEKTWPRFPGPQAASRQTQKLAPSCKTPAWAITISLLLMGGGPIGRLPVFIGALWPMTLGPCSLN